MKTVPTHPLELLTQELLPASRRASFCDPSWRTGWKT